MNVTPEQYFLPDQDPFPNNRLPVLIYRNVLQLPLLFPVASVRRLFHGNNWKNNWRNGIYTYHHYHSVTHEAIGICKGKTELQLGGPDGITVPVSRGDVLVIPAGVAHKNLKKENSVVCVGGYPGGLDFDMNYGHAGERPATDRNIALVPLPSADPVFGRDGGLTRVWPNIRKKQI